MKKAKLLSLALAAVLLCGCIIGFLMIGTSAASTATNENGGIDYKWSIKSAEGDYTTLTEALQAAANMSWGENDTLTLTFYANAQGKVTFDEMGRFCGVPTIWRGNRTPGDEANWDYGNKLPITIKGNSSSRGSSWVAAKGRYVFFTNDYTFENFSIQSTSTTTLANKGGTDVNGDGVVGDGELRTSVFAGSGNVVLKTPFVNGYVNFYGDNFSEGAYLGWTAGDVAAIKEANDGHVPSSMSLGNGIKRKYAQDMGAVGYTPEVTPTTENYTEIEFKAATGTLEEGFSLKPYETTAEMILAEGFQKSSTVTVRNGTSPVANAILTVNGGTFANDQDSNNTGNIYVSYGSRVGDVTVNIMSLGALPDPADETAVLDSFGTFAGLGGSEATPTVLYGNYTLNLQDWQSGINYKFGSEYWNVTGELSITADGCTFSGNPFARKGSDALGATKITTDLTDCVLSDDFGPTTALNEACEFTNEFCGVTISGKWYMGSNASACKSIATTIDLAKDFKWKKIEKAAPSQGETIQVIAGEGSLAIGDANASLLEIDEVDNTNGAVKVVMSGNWYADNKYIKAPATAQLDVDFYSHTMYGRGRTYVDGDFVYVAANRMAPTFAQIILDEKINVGLYFEKAELDKIIDVDHPSFDNITTTLGTLSGEYISDGTVEVVNGVEYYYIAITGISPKSLNEEITLGGRVFTGTTTLGEILDLTIAFAAGDDAKGEALIALCNAIKKLGGAEVAGYEPADVERIFEEEAAESAAFVSTGVGVVMNDAVGLTIAFDPAANAFVAGTHTIYLDNGLDITQYAKVENGFIDIFVAVADAQKPITIEIHNGEVVEYKLTTSVEFLASAYEDNADATNILAYIQVANAYAALA